MSSNRSTSREIATLPQNAIELTVSQTRKQVDKIQSLMKSVMREGVHYGSVPGVVNKFLYKAGAEKLCLVFRLIPEYKVEKTVYDEINGVKGHITYDVTCSLVHQPSGAYMGQGVGTCSTLEKKYRYRNEDLPTGVELPSAWWNSRKLENLPKILKNSHVEPKSAADMKKKGLELAPGKVGGKWEIVYRRKIENSDIADVYNTVIKMAKKRALVDATITALAVSDMFTQDPESAGGTDPEEEEAAAPEKEAGQKKGGNTTRARRKSGTKGK